MRSVTIQPADPASADAFALLQQLDTYLLGLYPPESNHLLSVEALRQPNVIFLSATVDGRVAGCGAVVNQAGAYAEIKRVFVLAECRGLQLGQAILAELEARASAAGLRIARLETGVAQPAAIRLF